MTFLALCRHQFVSIVKYMWSTRWRYLHIFMILFAFAVVYKDGFPAIHFSIGQAAGADVELGFVNPVRGDIPPGTFGIVFTFFMTLILGEVWAVRTWRGAGPTERDYFWTLPVGRARHELVRTAAGAMALLCHLLVFALAMVAGNLAGQGGAGLALMGPSAWASLFVGPLMVFLVSTVAVLRLKHPTRWMIGIAYGVGLAGSLFLQSSGSEQLVRLAHELVNGSYGIFTTLLGPVFNIATGWFHQFPIERWPLASCVWLLVSGVAVVIAAHIPSRR